MKFLDKQKAIQLRKQGKSYNEILKEVTVSKSSLSIWLRNITLTKKQEKRLYVTLRQENIYRLAKKRQADKEVRKLKIFSDAKKELKTRCKNPLFLCGLMLYWAEGDKSEDVEQIKFNNSDPIMISFMLRWFSEICLIPREKVKIELHIHELHNQKEIEKYWSNLTKVPLNHFHKTQIKPTSLGQRKKILYNGTCAIKIFDRSLFRRVKGWHMAFIEDMDKILKTM